MFRTIAIAALSFLLAACAATAPATQAPTATPSPTEAAVVTPAPTPAPTLSPTPSPSPTARPTPSPSPTPQPTISDEDLAQMFLLMADGYNAGVCADNQALERASDSELFAVAIDLFGRSADDTERFGQDVLLLFVENTGNPLLLNSANQINEASLAVAEVYRQIAAAKDIDELFDIYDTRARRDAENDMNSAGGTMREHLGLPERPEDPCTRET